MFIDVYAWAGCLCMFIDVYASLWMAMRMKVYGCFWMLMNVYGRLSIFMMFINVYGCLWTFIGEQLGLVMGIT